MTNQTDEIIAGWQLSLLELAASGAIGSVIVSGCKLFGRNITLTPKGTGFYAGFVTMMHTLLMEDFQFIKNYIPRPLKNRVTRFAVDAAVSVSINYLFAVSAYNLGSLVDSSWTPEDTLLLMGISEGANLATNHGLPALFRQVPKIIKWQLGIKNV